jgi:hypothetical protein
VCFLIQHLSSAFFLSVQQAQHTLMGASFVSCCLFSQQQIAFQYVSVHSQVLRSHPTKRDVGTIMMQWSSQISACWQQPTVSLYVLDCCWSAVKLCQAKPVSTPRRCTTETLLELIKPATLQAVLRLETTYLTELTWVEDQGQIWMSSVTMQGMGSDQSLAIDGFSKIHAEGPRLFPWPLFPSPSCYLHVWIPIPRNLDPARRCATVSTLEGYTKPEMSRAG